LITDQRHPSNHKQNQVTGPGGKRIWQAADKSEETFSFEADAVRVCVCACVGACTLTDDDD